MSSAAMKWAKNQNIKDGLLSAVVARLAQYADANGAAFPAQATLAIDCGVSERSVRRALALLDSLGVIKRTPRSKGHFGRTSDLIVLAIHRQFDIGRATIAKARSRTLQPDKLSSATGQIVRGITKGTTEPYQEGENTYVERLAQGERPLPTDGADLAALTPWGSA
ncbi:MAG: helix-turn-helix domain-containing protein [Mesorhizobium sp.]|uniref:helix-turn-helix domain-containing protein n=1 Tax=Mesorhizobium sp. TaxID=1871066 RepID=UPI001223E5D6|nr:helix-turn-helix domain-containing protein [Mesorhizobium sp.]TIO14905.1 MAG: helix-turn-helix domain-containing protein [Mesorhizobium sp.]